MNLKEAYATLELSESAGEDAAKKRFRELSKKLHPDNKETGDEAKFKKINEAYQRIQKGEDDPVPMQGGGGWGSHFQHQQVIQLENVETNLTISFKESVVGCKKEVKYSRKTKCRACKGAGEVQLNNGCKKCGGRGQIINRQGHMVMVTSCDECHGRVNVIECTTCHGQGTLHADVSVHVSVPAGIQNGNTLRLQGMGNYAGSFMGLADQHTDAFCHIAVTPEPGLSIDGQNVVSHMTISLLDALRGCKRQVKTIYGEKEIQVKPQSRNRDEVAIPNLGVGGGGNHIVILDVQYPKNTDKLIGVLVDEVV